MKITPKTINSLILFKLPLAFLAGVRVKTLTQNKAIVQVSYKWINQNPFKSMFWAVQAMAAELSTGVLVMQEIKLSKKKISMLVTHQEGSFLKKATGKILFVCEESSSVREAIKRSIEKRESQIVRLTSTGKNSDGVIVSKFQFEWSLKVKE